MRPLPRAFFADDADLVARRLLGRLLVAARPGEPASAVRIVETEAYFGPRGANPGLARRRARHLAPVRGGDPASHSFRGRTERNRAMWGPAGRAYVYLIYGTNECMNVVTGAEGEPQAVLLRAGEPVLGVEAMRARRPGVRDRDLARGPGNLCRALGVTRADYGADLARPPLFLADAAPARRVLRTPRIGVTAAADAMLRFVDAGSPSVSGRRPRTPTTTASVLRSRR